MALYPPFLPQICPCIHPFFLLYRIQGHKRYRCIVLNKVHIVHCHKIVGQRYSRGVKDMTFFNPRTTAFLSLFTMRWNVFWQRINFNENEKWVKIFTFAYNLDRRDWPLMVSLTVKRCFLRLPLLNIQKHKYALHVGTSSTQKPLCQMKTIKSNQKYVCHESPGRHNLRSFLAANSTQNYFLIARMLRFLWQSRRKCCI